MIEKSNNQNIMHRLRVIIELSVCIALKDSVLIYFCSTVHRNYILFYFNKNRLTFFLSKLKIKPSHKFFGHDLN